MYRNYQLLEKLIRLREEVYQEGLETYKEWEKEIEREDYKESALNFAYYLALRRRDIRSLQEALVPYGLSSLGRLESRTIYNIDAVIKTLAILLNKDYPEEIKNLNTDSYLDGDILLQEKNIKIFGSKPSNRYSSIMVTLPTEAAEKYSLVRDLIAAGMNAARINCSHDNQKFWSKMIKNIRKAEKELGKECKISMDIAGPKTRIDAIYTIKMKPSVQVGEKLFLTGKKELKSYYDYDIVLRCGTVEILDLLKTEDPVLIDDGMIETKVAEVKEEGVVLEVVKLMSGKKGKIRAEKGLNFPKTNQSLPILTEKDLEDLEFVLKNADIIGLSFVRTPEDIDVFHKEMVRVLGEEEARGKVIMAKIETVDGVNNLPEIIVKGASRNLFCVMIARGDLAVEAGYLRLSELQEEILWICEAAHIPVVWATEILRNMAKTGIPTRAEITDAAMGGRADCMMLNKGEYIVDTVKALDDILVRMKSHQYKKTHQLRALSIAELEE